MSAASAELTPEQEVIAAFSAELPETVKVLNAPAITEALYFDPDHTVQDDELPPQEVFDEHEKAAEGLTEQGVLQSAEYLGMTVYGLTWADSEEEADQ